MIISLQHHLQHAIYNLQAAKLRSFLAILGILVGTAAMVALLSCSQIATEKAMAQFKSLGMDFLSISLFQKTTINTTARDIPLSMFRDLPIQIPDIINIAPYSTAYPAIYYAGRVINGTIVGADDTLTTLLRLTLDSGHFLSSVHSFERVCVIGSGIAKTIGQQSLTPPVGQNLQIGSVLYTITGVLASSTDNSFFNGDINQSVIIPIAGMTLVNQQSSINNALIRLSSEKSVGIVRNRLQEILYEQAPTLNIVIRSAQEIITRMANQAHIFNLLIGIIGAISLLVGGIGIMNVSLMSVTERIKEIGLRKALGATRRDIQALFMIESILLAVIGGLIGIVVGEIFTFFVSIFNHWKFIFYIWPVCISLTVSLVTGVFFGSYPAMRAARLTAIDCLRHV